MVPVINRSRSNLLKTATPGTLIRRPRLGDSIGECKDDPSPLEWSEGVEGVCVIGGWLSFMSRSSLCLCLCWVLYQLGTHHKILSLHFKPSIMFSVVFNYIGKYVKYVKYVKLKFILLQFLFF